MENITIPIAFIAGIISFLSPCILPLVPAFMSYLVGNANKISRTKIFINSIFFVLGFVIIFSLIGVLLASVLSSIALDARIYLSYIGGAVIIFFGVYLTGILKIPFLNQTKRFRPKRFKSNYLTSFVFGVAFAAGWTPCIGAILGGILTIAIVNPTSALNLMLSYSAGLGIPFLIAGLFISQFSKFIQKFTKFMKYFTVLM